MRRILSSANITLFDKALSASMGAVVHEGEFDQITARLGTRVTTRHRRLPLRPVLQPQPLISRPGFQGWP